MGSDANSVVLLLGVPYGHITFDHCHTHISVTLLIQALVVGPAPGSPRCKRVEFSPAEIRQAVEAGATLARRNETVHSEQSGRKHRHLHNIICYSTCSIEIVSSGSNT